MRSNEKRVEEILATVKGLATEYYRLTGKPLGVTGEVAEYVVAKELNLELAPPRTAGYDATRRRLDGSLECIQIKGRAFTGGNSQKIGKFNISAKCDTAILVLLDIETLEPHEIWEAPFSNVLGRLAVAGSKARARGVLSVSEFKGLRDAKPVYPTPADFR